MNLHKQCEKYTKIALTNGIVDSQLSLIIYVMLSDVKLITCTSMSHSMSDRPVLAAMCKRDLCEPMVCRYRCVLLFVSLLTAVVLWHCGSDSIHCQLIQFFSRQSLPSLAT